MVLCTSAFRIQALFVLLNISQFSDAAINLNIARPTNFPSSTPSALPSTLPSFKPSVSKVPSKVPTRNPTTFKPTTSAPTKKPTGKPSAKPSVQPSHSPSRKPSTEIVTSTQEPTPLPTPGTPTTSPRPTEEIVKNILPLIPIFDIPNEWCMWLPVPFLFCYLFGEDGRGDELGRSGSTNDVDPSLWEGMWAKVTEYMASLEHVVLPGGVQPVDNVQTSTLSPIE